MRDLADAKRYAALVAPVVDRVVIGTHLRARERGRELARRFGAGRVGMLVELRIALPRGPVTAEGFAAVCRYVPRGEQETELAAQVSQRLVEIGADRSVRATARGLEFIEGIYDLHAATLAGAWDHRRGSLDRLAVTAGRVLGHAAATGGPAFAAANPPYEREGDPVALVVFNRLAALRYHRADAHAAAWAGHGLTAEQVVGLAPGPLRERIERATNERAAAAYEPVDGQERLAFLADLAALPG